MTSFKAFLIRAQDNGWNAVGFLKKKTLSKYFCHNFESLEKFGDISITFLNSRFDLTKT